jgi:hypothetical protein
VVDGKLYVGDEDGDVVVLAADKTKKVLSEVNVGAPVYSTCNCGQQHVVPRLANAPLRDRRGSQAGRPREKVASSAAAGPVSSRRARTMQGPD